MQNLPDELSLSAVLPPVSETLHLPEGCDGRVWYHQGRSRTLRPHRHKELEANLVTVGTASYLLGDTRHDLKPGTLLWLFPTQDHVLLNQSPDFEMWIAVWTPQLTAQYCGDLSDGAVVLAAQDAPPHYHSRLAEAQKTCLDPVLRDLTHAASDPPRCNAGLGYLLLLLWDAHEHAVRAGNAPPRREIHPAVEKTVRLLRDETEPISVEEMAGRVGLSAGRLSRVFLAQTGQSIPDFRNRRRVERFLRTCDASPERTLMEAALDAGFGSYAQFFRVFKAIMGCSPGEYRK